MPLVYASGQRPASPKRLVSLFNREVSTNFKRIAVQSVGINLMKGQLLLSYLNLYDPGVPPVEKVWV